MSEVFPADMPSEAMVLAERFPSLDSPDRLQTSSRVAALVLQASRLTQDFAAVERIPRYEGGRRENDVEHSYMLAIIAPDVAQALELNLDIDKVRRFALVHDLLEVVVGDVATFNLGHVELAEKERLEQEAKLKLVAELPPLLACDLEEYEQQDMPEAVFVRMVDKLLPAAVDVTGEGARVMREDYGVNTYEELVISHNALHARLAEKYGQAFPDLVAAHAVLCVTFENEYRKNYTEVRVEEKPRNPTEVERKYLVSLEHLPASIDLSQTPSIHLRQGYLATAADGSEIRIRSTNGAKFELTTKSGGMIAREEKTIEISRELFESLWQQTEGRQVVKTRHKIPHDNGLTIELDVYEGHLSGLVTAEVEFDGRPTEAAVRATAFEPPAWFGPDVSEDPRYKNHSLAERIPHETVELVRAKLQEAANAKEE